jgi:hypothetical protein
VRELGDLPWLYGFRALRFAPGPFGKESFGIQVMRDFDHTKPISRRHFLGASSALATFAVVSRLDLSAAEDKRPSRLRYDISKFNATDPKLIKYEEASRVLQAGTRARRIAALPGGGFLVACEQGALEYTNSGVRVREFATPTPARCAARGDDGVVYVGTREGIHTFDKEGRRTGMWAAANSRTWFTGLAASENDVFAADSGNRVVLRFDQSGKVIGRIGLKDKDRNVPGIVLPSPYLHVALGRDGLLRVNNTGRHCVELYTVDGDLEFSWGKPGAAIEGFCGCCNPVGLAVLPDGRCVTAEKGLPRVKVYSATGDFECVVAGTESFPQNTRHGAARDAKDGTMGGLDVAVGSDGKILVLDLVTGHVHQMREKRA